MRESTPVTLDGSDGYFLTWAVIEKKTEWMEAIYMTRREARAKCRELGSAFGVFRGAWQYYAKN